MMNVRLNNISIKCMLAILLVGLFASCKDEMDEADEKEYRPSRIESLGIAFRTSDDGFEKPKTRGVLETFNIDDKVSVLAMKENNGTWVRVFDNNILDITNIGEIKWYYENKKKWEKGYRYKFRGFYPQTFNSTAGETDACADGFTYDVAGNNKDKNKGNPLGSNLKLNNYTTANNPRNNTDILVSETVNRDCSTSIDASIVPLEMKHLLACVDFKFKVKEGSNVTINSFTVHGYAKKGNCEVSDFNNWTPVYDDSPAIKSNQTVNYHFVYNNTNSQITIDNGQDNYVFKDKNSNLILSIDEMYNKGQVNYFYSWHGKTDKFYAVLKSEFNNASDNLGRVVLSDNLLSSDAYEPANYKGLLFIPQELEREGVKFNINFSAYRYDWYNDDTNVKQINDIELRHSVFAEIKFYFDSDPTQELTAFVDLTANGNVKKWEAGKKYVYTIGVYEYQATANITIEDWHTHSYEEELK